MKNNMGKTDRIVRVVAGIVLLAAGAMDYTSTLGIVAIVLGLILLFTASVNSCPIYSALGISTAHK